MRLIQKQRGVRLACLLVALAWGGAVHAQTMFGLTPWVEAYGRSAPDRNGLPLPIGPAGVFTGGMTIGTAATFPPLYVPKAPAAMSIMQISHAGGGAIDPGWRPEPHGRRYWPLSASSTPIRSSIKWRRRSTTRGRTPPRCSHPVELPSGRVSRPVGRHHHLRRRGQSIRRRGPVRDRPGSFGGHLGGTGRQRG